MIYSPRYFWICSHCSALNSFCSNDPDLDNILNFDDINDKEYTFKRRCHYCLYTSVIVTDRAMQVKDVIPDKECNYSVEYVASCRGDFYTAEEQFFMKRYNYMPTYNYHRQQDGITQYIFELTDPGEYHDSVYFYYGNFSGNNLSTNIKVTVGVRVRNILEFNSLIKLTAPICKSKRLNFSTQDIPCLVPSLFNMQDFILRLEPVYKGVHMIVEPVGIDSRPDYFYVFYGAAINFRTEFDKIIETIASQSG